MTTSNYVLEINTNDVCNFRCKYCYEGESLAHYRKRENSTEWYIEYILKLYNSDFFKNNFKELLIPFWGGEPTLEAEFIEDIVTAMKDYPNIQLFMYTNGYDIPDNLIRLMTDKSYKFGCQVSYDGQPIHDLMRKHYDGSNTADKVRDTILKLDKLGVNFALKSTITKATIGHLFEAFKDVSQFKQGYFPTFDNSELFVNVTDEEFDEFLQVLERQLTEIIKYSLKNNINNFKWFELNCKQICSAGMNFSILDLDGHLYACHGCLYDDKFNHQLSDKPEFDEFWFKRSYELYKYNMKLVPQECSNCPATVCFRCQAHSFRTSEKVLYSEKWMDFTQSEKFCNFYKKITNYSKAFNRMINKY